MLIKICLAVAIAAGLFAAGLSFVKVKEKITTLQTDLSNTQITQHTFQAIFRNTRHFMLNEAARIAQLNRLSNDSNFTGIGFNEAAQYRYQFTLPVASNTGDAYVELKNYDQATTYFKKAADKASNKFLSPFYLKKLGLVYEAQNDNKSAADTYKKLKTDYPESTEAQSIEAYIARTDAKQ